LMANPVPVPVPVPMPVPMPVPAPTKTQDTKAFPGRPSNAVMNQAPVAAARPSDEGPKFGERFPHPQNPPRVPEPPKLGPNQPLKSALKRPSPVASSSQPLPKMTPGSLQARCPFRPKRLLNDKSNNFM
jgi:hypothetical protein